MIILLAVLGIGLVATPIVLENMDPAPVVSNIVNKPTVNYSPAPVVKEDIKVINERVGKLLIQISDINWEEIKKLNKDEAKDKVVDALTKQQKLKENILSEIKGKPRFDFLRKKLEFESNIFNPENFDNLWDIITGKISTPIYPYASSAPQLIYTETKICEEPCEETEEPSEHKHKGRKKIFHVFNDGEIHITTAISSYSSPAPAQRAIPKHYIINRIT